MASPVRKEADLPLAVPVLHVATQLCAVSAGVQPVLEQRVAVGAVISTWASATLHKEPGGQAESNVGGCAWPLSSADAAGAVQQQVGLRQAAARLG